MKIEILPCHGEHHDQLGRHCPDCDGYNHYFVFFWDFDWRDLKEIFWDEHIKELTDEREPIFPPGCDGVGWANQLFSAFRCLEEKSTLDKPVRIPQQNINWRVRLGMVAFDQGCMPVFCGVISEMHKIWREKKMKGFSEGIKKELEI